MNVVSKVGLLLVLPRQALSLFDSVLHYMFGRFQLCSMYEV